MKCIPMRYTHEMHAHEMHAHEIRDHKMHARKVHAHETPAHHCFGDSLAQTVVDLSRSEFQNTSFCAGCRVVPIARRTRCAAEALGRGTWVGGHVRIGRGSRRSTVRCML